jgi:hypothetical protein
LILQKDKDRYTVDVDVFFDNLSILPDNNLTTPMGILTSGLSDNDEVVTISFMTIFNLKIMSEGLYKIVMRLLDGPTEALDKKILDTRECLFIVSKNWVKL